MCCICYFLTLHWCRNQQFFAIKRYLGESMSLDDKLQSNREMESRESVFEKGSGCLTDLHVSGWNLLAEEVSFPIAVINQKSLLNNAKWMQEFSNKSSVKLAPHGKTSMAPALFKVQLEQGCWGISLATVPQVINAFQNGINRIMLANQLVGAYHMKLIADLLSTNELEFYCFVDSVENIHVLGKYFDVRNVSLNILVEVGILNGRCGWRDTDKIAVLLDAIGEYPHLHLCGISFYEGVIQGDDAADKIVEFVKSITTIFGELCSENKFDSKDIIITGAGSAWYDIVAKELSANNVTPGVQYLPVIRPGCYLVHDTGIYQDAQKAVVDRSQLACDISGDLISSLELWAYIQSVPESGLAVIGLGKRDVAFDAGLPTAEYLYRPGTKQPVKIENGCQVVKIMDQHCMMKFDANTSLKPGDLVCFSTSHPCLTLDKWRQVGIIDDNFIVKQTIETYF